jgi:hypothetical protein
VPENWGENWYETDDIYGLALADAFFPEPMSA